MRRRAGFIRVATTMAALCLAALAPAAAQQQQTQAEPPKSAGAVLPKGKRLILKDGTYQIVRSYERKGDRVRFLSAERGGWEEVPAELVDWEATLNAEKQEAEQRRALEEKIEELKKIQIAVDVDVDASLEVAPGVFLPEGDGLFVVEAGRARTLGPSDANVKRDKGRLLTQILVPLPVIPTRHRVELAGARAQFRLETAQPEFYLRTADDHEPEIELIRVRVKGNTRLVEFINTNVLGESARSRDSLSLERWKVARGVYRFTLSQPLEPGEYVLAEVIQGESINLSVWDFGFDAAPRPSSPR